MLASWVLTLTMGISSSYILADGFSPIGHLPSGHSSSGILHIVISADGLSPNGHLPGGVRILGILPIGHLLGASCLLSTHGGCSPIGH